MLLFGQSETAERKKINLDFIGYFTKLVHYNWTLSGIKI